MEKQKKCEHLDNYGYEGNISEPVELFDDGFAIRGCCGGGCVIIQRIIYCPFCGIKLFKNKNKYVKHENVIYSI